MTPTAVSPSQMEPLTICSYDRFTVMSNPQAQKPVYVLDGEAPAGAIPWRDLVGISCEVLRAYGDVKKVIKDLLPEAMIATKAYLQGLSVKTTAPQRQKREELVKSCSEEQDIPLVTKALTITETPDGFVLPAEMSTQELVTAAILVLANQRTKTLAPDHFCPFLYEGLAKGKGKDLLLPAEGSSGLAQKEHTTVQPALSVHTLPGAAVPLDRPALVAELQEVARGFGFSF